MLSFTDAFTYALIYKLIHICSYSLTHLPMLSFTDSFAYALYY